MKPVDVLIVGGGPAGLATAIATSRKGLRVAVIERCEPPIDKTCGEGLLPSAIAALGELGVRIDSCLGIPFSNIRFSDEKSSATAPLSAGCGIGLRRRDLHLLLAARAEAEGVELCWGARITDIQATGVWIGRESRPCRWLIGADGQHSVVRGFAQLAPGKRARSRFGFRQHFAIAPWSGAVEVHWGDRVQLIVTPTGQEEICVVVLTSDLRVRIEQALQKFPEIASRLRGAAVISRESGAITCLSRARAAVRGNVALVGDASFTMDGISGSGLALAFQEALALAEALVRENLIAYEKAHARITRAAAGMTRLLLMMDASPKVRRVVLGILARNPALFSGLIALHAGNAAHARGREFTGLSEGRARFGCRSCEPT